MNYGLGICHLSFFKLSLHVSLMPHYNWVVLRIIAITIEQVTSVGPVSRLLTFIYRYYLFSWLNINCYFNLYDDGHI